jgi:hypothetical protein
VTGWDGLAPTELPIRCGQQDHRVVWAGGELIAADHPDADRERALTALGADPFPCLDLLDAWNRHADDLDVLVLANRGAAEVPLRLDGSDSAWAAGSSAAYSSSLVVRPRGGRRRAPRRLMGGSSGASVGPGGQGGGFGWTSYSPLSGSGARAFVGGPPRMVFGPEPGQDGEIERLLRAGSGLPERLVATVIAAWVELIDTFDVRVPDAETELRAALYGRLMAVLQGWANVSAPVDLTLAGPGQVSAVSRADGRIQVALPFSWLRDVWVPGLATVFGRLCLSAESTGDDQWRLQTVGPDLGPARTMTITLD